MLTHVIAHGGHKSLYRKLALGEKSLVTVTLGIEPASVVSFQSDALPTEQPPPSSAHSKKWSFWRMVFFSAAFFGLFFLFFFSIFLFSFLFYVFNKV